MWIKLLLVLFLLPLVSGCAVKPTEPKGNTKASIPTTQTESTESSITLLNVIRYNAYSSNETFVIEYMYDSDKHIVNSTYPPCRTYIFLDCTEDDIMWVTMNNETSSVEIHAHSLNEIKER